jgi:hypothetical protein
MRCALALFSNAAFEGIFRIQVLESARIDRSCHLMVRQQTWQESKLRSVVVVGLQMWNRVSDFQAWHLCQASCAGHQAAITCGADGGR